MLKIRIGHRGADAALLIYCDDKSPLCLVARAYTVGKPRTR